jgi:hypothetical protein
MKFFIVDLLVHGVCLPDGNIRNPDKAHHRLKLKCRFRLSSISTFDPKFSIYKFYSSSAGPGMRTIWPENTDLKTRQLDNWH